MVPTRCEERRQQATRPLRCDWSSVFLGLLAASRTPGQCFVRPPIVRDDGVTSRGHRQLKNHVVARIREARPPKKENGLVSGHCTQIVQKTSYRRRLPSPGARLAHENVFILQDKRHRQGNVESA